MWDLPLGPLFKTWPLLEGFTYSVVDKETRYHFLHFTAKNAAQGRTVGQEIRWEVVVNNLKAFQIWSLTVSP